MQVLIKVVDLVTGVWSSIVNSILNPYHMQTIPLSTLKKMVGDGRNTLFLEGGVD